MATHERLSHAKIEALPTPERSRSWTYDAAASGLAVCVTPAGTRIFYWVGRVRARPTRIQLGRYPAMPLDAARVEARRIAAEAASGGVPVTRRKQSAAELTLQSVFTAWLTNHSRPHKRTWERDQRRFDRTLGDWRHRAIVDITRADVMRWHVELGEQRGPYAANASLVLLRTLYGFAVTHLGWQGTSPTTGVKRFASPSRDRFLRGDELPRFFAAVAGLQRPAARDFILLCLFTGARRGNVCAMRWVDVDLDRREWRVPAEQAKSGKPMVIALSEPAIEILRRRQAESTSQWVLPGHGKSGHYQWPKAAWQKVLQESGLTDLRIHDLRRTLGSWQAMTGASLTLIAKTLGHTSLSATQIYARLQMDPVRDAVNAATEAMLSAAQEKTESDKNLGECLGESSAGARRVSASSATSPKRPKNKPKP